jgi:hypothetical protein
MPNVILIRKKMFHFFRMADIIGGSITVGGVEYTVVLRPVVDGMAPGANVGPEPVAPAGNNDMMGGKRSKKQKKVNKK